MRVSYVSMVIKTNIVCQLVYYTTKKKKVKRGTLF